MRRSVLPCLVLVAACGGKEEAPTQAAAPDPSTPRVVDAGTLAHRVAERDPRRARPKRRDVDEDLRERPFVSLQERCEYVEAVSGVSVSRSTMCRAIARIGSTRKKGGESPQSETSSRGRHGG